MTEAEQKKCPRLPAGIQDSAMEWNIQTDDQRR
jgi:hypothetical protein